MKRFIVVLAIGAFLFSASDAHAVANVWTGAIDTAWNDLSNWSGTGWPGDSGTADTATIDADPNSRQPVYSTGTATVDSIVIDAASNDVVVSVTMSGGTLTVGDSATDFQLVGGDADSDTATFSFSGGTFSASRFDLDGGDTAARESILAITSALSLGSALMDMEGFMKSTGTAALTVGAITITDNGTLDLDSTADFTASSIAIDASGGAKSLTIDGDGVFIIGGAVAMTSGASSSYNAKLIVNSAATGFQPDTFDINGGSANNKRAEIQANADFCVADPDTSVDFSVDGFVNLVLASGVSVYAGDLTFEDSSTAFSIVGAAGTMPEFVVDASGFTFASGTLKMRGPLKMRHATACP